MGELLSLNNQSDSTESREFDFFVGDPDLTPSIIPYSPQVYQEYFLSRVRIILVCHWVWPKNK